MRLAWNNHCPYCHSNYFVRLPRTTFLRLIGLFKLYECDLCRKEFLLFSGKPVLSTIQKPKLVPIKKVVER
jgi:transposase-like protein